MKKITFLMAFLTLLSWQGNAQINIGSGTVTGQAMPVEPFFGFTYSQVIYLSSEISASGNITGIKYFADAGTVITNSDDWTVYIGHTTKTDFTSTTDWVSVASLTQVHTGTVTLTGGEVTITFSSPFAYNGTDNLVIAVDENKASFDGSADEFLNTATATARGITFRSDATDPDPTVPPTASGTRNFIANIQLIGISQACPDPSALTVTNITTIAADLGWTENGTATTWDIEWGATGFTQGAGTMVTGTTTNPHNLTGLTSATTYEFYVRADCGAGQSSWVGPFSFTTAVAPGTCGIFTLDLIDTFGDGWNGGTLDVYINGTLFAGGLTIANGFGPDTTLIPVNTGDVLSFDYTASGFPGENEYNVYDQTGALVASEGLGGATPNDIGDFNIPTGITSCAACADPTALAVTNITTTAADLGWTENGTATTWDIEWDVTGFTQGTGTMVTGTTTNPHNLTGLTSGTTYEFYVRADCGGSGTSAWAGPFSFSTTPDYCAGDHFYDNGGAAGDYLINSDDTTVICPTSAGDVVAVTFNSFDTEAGFDDLTIFDGNGTGGTSFGTFDGTAIPGSFMSTDASGCLTFVFSSDNSVIGAGWDATITCNPPPACLDPSLLTVTNITTTAADLSWTENGTATTWNIEWDTTGFATGTGNVVSGTTTNPHSLTTLAANTTYDFYVQADCGADSSVWVGPFTFTTPCNAMVAPWTDDVELHAVGVVTTSECWTATAATSYNWNVSNAGTPSGGTGPLTAFNGTNFFYTEASGAGVADTAQLVSPMVDITTLTTPILEFYYHMVGAEIGDLFTDVWDGTTWVSVDTISGPQQAAQGDAFMLKSIDLSAFSGTVQVRFTAVSNGSFEGDISIDNVRVFELLANDVELLSISSTPAGCGLGMETVTVEVRNNGTAMATGVDVVYALNGTAIAPETITGNILPGDTVTHVFTTLANMTTPAIYTIDAWTVMAIDADNSNDTIFAGFTTEHITPSLAFSGTVVIPDNNPNGVSSIICTGGLVNNVLDTCYRLSALVIDSLVHTWETDINMWLISPAGDTLEVSTDNGSGSGSDGYINVTFTDTASTNIVGSTNLTNGFFTTEEAVGLAKFNGTDPNGAWTLLVADDAGGDFGTLYDWHLEFTDHNFTVNVGADTNVCSTDSIVLDAGAGNYSYAWSTGQNTQTITLDTNFLGGNGTYNITVTVLDTVSGCTSTDTIVVNYSVCVGINEVNNNINLNVYPNPNNGVFTLNVNTTDVNELEIKVMNLQGQVIFTKNNFDNISSINEKIDLSNNANGIYFITVTSDKGIVTHKVVVQ